MKIIPALLFFIFSFTALPALAANLDAVKERMQERQPAIAELWKDGLIGENNEGYLEARANLSSGQRDLVEAENRDRRLVYEAIAKRAGSTTEKVAKARAAQIHARAAPGLWLEDSNGTWYKK